METEFTPIASLAGGLMIGVAAVLLMAFHGRIMGATGILTGAIYARGGDQLWRILFLAGMICGPLVYLQFAGQFPKIQVPVGVSLLAAGGVIVGFGVSLGSGCTSGHGVCGIARGSARSFVATLVFMASTALTVYVMRHVLGG